jgi:hypothetical protein
MRIALCALGLAIVALIAGCGSGGGQGAPPSATGTVAAGSKDPGLDAVTRMIRAVRSRDRVAQWSLLSTSARRRLGPTFPAFRRRGGPELERTLHSFLTHPFRKVVSERIIGRFGVVTIASGRNTFATPLRLEHGVWRLDLGESPFSIRVLGPDPGSVSRVRQIAYEIHGAPEGATAVLYVDGITLQSREAVARGTATVYANLETALAPGFHNAVAFATHGDSAAAKVWTFVAR